MTRFILTLLLGVCFTLARAQSLPTLAPTATYTDADGAEQTESSISEGAPLEVLFRSGAENVEGWSAHYEWHFYREGQRASPYLIRYEEETRYTFREAGSHRVELWAVFTQGTDSVTYTDSYWSEEGTPLTVIISESKLEMPNAFSPNGDGINDIYRAKQGYRSIVEFEASIFNRWGQRLHVWTDPADGWDGTYRGKPVAQGVYFVLVKARGADGRRFSIRRDVNLLRGYEETAPNP